MDYIKIKFGSNFDPSGEGLGKTIQEIFRPRPVNPMFSSREHLWTPQMDIFETSEEIMIWAREKEVVDSINKDSRNKLFLPEIKLAKNLKATNAPEADILINKKYRKGFELLPV